MVWFLSILMVAFFLFYLKLSARSRHNLRNLDKEGKAVEARITDILHEESHFDPGRFVVQIDDQAPAHKRSFTHNTARLAYQFISTDGQSIRGIVEMKEAELVQFQVGQKIPVKYQVDNPQNNAPVFKIKAARENV